MVSRTRRFLELLIRNGHDIARIENVGIFSLQPQLGVVRVIPERVDQETVLLSQAAEAFALDYFMSRHEAPLRIRICLIFDSQEFEYV